MYNLEYNIICNNITRNTVTGYRSRLLQALLQGEWARKGFLARCHERCVLTSERGHGSQATSFMSSRQKTFVRPLTTKELCDGLPRGVTCQGTMQYIIYLYNIVLYHIILYYRLHQKLHYTYLMYSISRFILLYYSILYYVLYIVNYYALAIICYII